MVTKSCSIFNYASHYREGIYLLMDKELDVDFYFGDKLNTKIKKINYTIFNNSVAEVSNKWLFGPLYYQKGVVKLLRKKYDKYIVTGELYCISTWLFMIFAKFTNKKVYLWGHGWYGRESVIKKIIKKLYYSLCDGVFLYGDYAKELMIDNGIKEDKLHVIYNSLDYDSQLENRKNIDKTSIYTDHFGNEDKVIYFIGRLNKSKRLDMVIDALSILKSRGKEYNLVLIGTGDDKDNLKDYAKQKGFKNIWFYGACYDETELSNLIYNVELCVSPGNIGLTAIHSLMYGTPVITHNSFPYQGPEFEAIQENETGMFFEYNNVESLANKIEEWFEISSKQSREEIAEKCFKIIDEKYNPHYQIEVLKSVLDK